MLKNTADEANHFDVGHSWGIVGRGDDESRSRQVILAFGSVVLDGLSFAFVFMAPSYQYVLACTSLPGPLRITSL